MNGQRSQILNTCFIYQKTADPGQMAIMKARETHEQEGSGILLEPAIMVALTNN